MSCHQSNETPPTALKWIGGRDRCHLPSWNVFKNITWNILTEKKTSAVGGAHTDYDTVFVVEEQIPWRNEKRNSEPMQCLPRSALLSVATRQPGPEEDHQNSTVLYCIAELCCNNHCDRTVRAWVTLTMISYRGTVNTVCR